MIHEIKILERVSLFRGIEQDNLSGMLSCLGVVKKYYLKNQSIIHAGEEVTSLGIVLDGQVQIVKDDILGNRMIVAGLLAGDIFAETIVCAGLKESPVDVYACDNCSVLWVSIKRIITTCSNSCSFHNRLILNILELLATKNLYLNNKMEFLAKRTIREKIMTYLSFQKEMNQSSSFVIPLNRNEMADYLCVDRSALSRELSKLREEGAIEYNKNQFNLFY